VRDSHRLDEPIAIAQVADDRAIDRQQAHVRSGVRRADQTRNGRLHQNARIETGFVDALGKVIHREKLRVEIRVGHVVTLEHRSREELGGTAAKADADALAAQIRHTVDAAALWHYEKDRVYIKYRDAA
jgi:hypothetical protein